jgi:nascent polypeptide-associated complex subunit alpha
MDPRAMKGMLDRLGIKSKSIASTRVVIECDGRDIVIEDPEITLIEGQGIKSFQISGKVSEIERAVAGISDDDVKFVQEQTGEQDAELVRKALEEAKGNIAEAILKLKKS